jgi:hypothetical protein
MLIYGKHGKQPLGNIQKLNRFENPRNEFIVAYLSRPAEQIVAADSRDVPFWETSNECRCHRHRGSYFPVDVLCPIHNGFPSGSSIRNSVMP